MCRERDDNSDWILHDSRFSRGLLSQARASPFVSQLYRECVDLCISLSVGETLFLQDIRKTIAKLPAGTRDSRSRRVNDVSSPRLASLGTFFMGDDNGVTGNVTINFTRIPTRPRNSAPWTMLASIFVGANLKGRENRKSLLRKIYNCASNSKLLGYNRLRTVQQIYYLHS